ncbi:MAG: hypothetical protein PHV37_00950 [Candidatus Gastranaerophilales bacterium]|nr:hypothetical protein [Candidatus Gastranaerophilales bacterium]
MRKFLLTIFAIYTAIFIAGNSAVHAQSIYDNINTNGTITNSDSHLKIDVTYLKTDVNKISRLTSQLGNSDEQEFAPPLLGEYDISEIDTYGNELKNAVTQTRNSLKYKIAPRAP